LQSSRRRLLRSSRLRRGDPSFTRGTVRRYQADIRARWSAIQRVVRATVVTNDALRLGDLPGLFRAAQIGPATRFQFRTDPAGKTEDFLKWLREQEDAGILETIRPGRTSRWQDVYVRAPYSQGVTHANSFLAAAGLEIDPSVVGSVFNRPIHAEALSLLYTRQFTDLSGITAAVDTQISRILTQGFAEGIGPRDMARNMSGAINTIGRNRSLVLARTETIRAHAAGTLNRYKEKGIKEVVGQAEFATAGDDRVCPQCAGLEGTTYSIDEASGVIPVHPQCRCVWLPVVSAAMAA
jgi:SPP1 gp7 family putative phage head morphogenesis protein